MIKRYMVFSGMNYYSRGGMGDFRGSSDDLQEALLLAKDKVMIEFVENPDWWEVYDTHEGSSVSRSWKLEELFK